MVEDKPKPRFLCGVFALKMAATVLIAPLRSLLRRSVFKDNRKQINRVSAGGSGCSESHIIIHRKCGWCQFQYGNVSVGQSDIEIGATTDCGKGGATEGITIGTGGDSKADVIIAGSAVDHKSQFEHTTGNIVTRNLKLGTDGVGVSTGPANHGLSTRVDHKCWLC